MSHPAEHLAFLARRDFVIPPGNFTHEERNLLARYGSWLDALASGAIQPATAGQEHFVKVARGQCEPQTDFERVWVKLLAHRNSIGGIVRAFQTLAQARANAARVEAEYSSARAAILAQVREQLDALDEAFAGHVNEAADQSNQAEQAVRELVLRLGRGIRLAGIRAAYYPGRVSWDTKRLDAYAQLHSEVMTFRKVGKPWVNLRFLDTPAEPGADALALSPASAWEKALGEESTPQTGSG